MQELTKSSVSDCSTECTQFFSTYQNSKELSGGTRFTQIIREKDEDRLRCRRASLLYGLPVDSLEVDLTQENWRLRAGFRQAVYSW